MTTFGKKNQNKTEWTPPAYRESSLLLHPDIMTGLYVVGKLLEDTGIAQSEKFWLDNLLWSPFLVQWRQYSLLVRVGLEWRWRKKKKNPFFLWSIVFWSSSPVSTQNSPQFFCVSLSPSYLSFQIGFRWLDRSIPHAITKRKVRNSQSSSIQYIQELKLFTLV